jgi:hypothetical protein
VLLHPEQIDPALGNGKPDGNIFARNLAKFSRSKTGHQDVSTKFHLKMLALGSTFSTSTPFSTTHLIPGDDPSRLQLQRQLTVLRWAYPEPHQFNVTGVWWLELDHPAALILTLLHTSMKFNAFQPDPFFGNDGYDVVAAHDLFALAPHVVDAQFHVRHA